nr:MAG TPA: hypothetical protein [Caudoviricetes sp.]
MPPSEPSSFDTSSPPPLFICIIFIFNYIHSNT